MKLSLIIAVAVLSIKASIAHTVELEVVVNGGLGGHQLAITTTTTTAAPVTAIVDSLSTLSGTPAAPSFDVAAVFASALESVKKRPPNIHPVSGFDIGYGTDSTIKYFIKHVQQATAGGVTEKGEITPHTCIRYMLHRGEVEIRQIFFWAVETNDTKLVHDILANVRIATAEYAVGARAAETNTPYDLFSSTTLSNYRLPLSDVRCNFERAAKSGLTDVALVILSTNIITDVDAALEKAAQNEKFYTVAAILQSAKSTGISVSKKALKAIGENAVRNRDTEALVRELLTYKVLNDLDISEIITSNARDLYRVFGDLLVEKMEDSEAIYLVLTFLIPHLSNYDVVNRLLETKWQYLSIAQLKGVAMEAHKSQADRAMQELVSAYIAKKSAAASSTP